LNEKTSKGIFVADELIVNSVWIDDVFEKNSENAFTPENG
jgi:hypothetical protein